MVVSKQGQPKPRLCPELYTVKWTIGHYIELTYRTGLNIERNWTMDIQCTYSDPAVMGLEIVKGLGTVSIRRLTLITF